MDDSTIHRVWIFIPLQVFYPVKCIQGSKSAALQGLDEQLAEGHWAGMSRNAHKFIL